MEKYKDRAFYLRYIKEYLKELSAIVGREVQENELLDIDTTQKLFKNTIQVASRKISIPFKDMKSERFKSLINSIDRTKQGGLYVWIKHSQELGTMFIPSIKEFNIDIKFNDISGEVIILTSEKGTNQLLIDFMINDDQKQFIEIEISGNSWNNIDLSNFQPNIEHE